MPIVGVVCTRSYVQTVQAVWFSAILRRNKASTTSMSIRTNAREIDLNVEIAVDLLRGIQQIPSGFPHSRHSVKNTSCRRLYIANLVLTHC